MNVKEYDFLETLHSLDDFVISLNKLNLTINYFAKHKFDISPHIFANHPMPINDSYYFTHYINTLYKSKYINFHVKDFSNDENGFPKINIKCYLTLTKTENKLLTTKGNKLRKQLSLLYGNNKIYKDSFYPWHDYYEKHMGNLRKNEAKIFHYTPGDGLPLSIKDQDKRRN